MKNIKNNPNSNKLPGGVTEDKIDFAIKKSGYPLQTRVCEQIKDRFYLFEEWSFIDKKTGEIRTTDIVAEKDFWLEEIKQPRVRPTLNLIIECKQSELPYVFFLSENTLSLPNFPFIAGLHTNDICLTTDTDRSSFSHSIIDTLSLGNDSFLSSDPLFCNKFSKCERKGKDLFLSGEMPFNEIIHPLLSAMNHFKNAEKPVSTAYYFDLHMVIGIGVLDAPMIGVKVNNEDHELISLPWVRVVKHQTDKEPKFNQWKNRYAIDLVHKDFLDKYLNENLLPFIERFSKLAIKHQEIIANGNGFVPDLYNIRRDDIEKRLQPVAFSNQLKRHTKRGLKKILKKNEI